MPIIILFDQVDMIYYSIDSYFDPQEFFHRDAFLQLEFFITLLVLGTAFLDPLLPTQRLTAQYHTTLQRILMNQLLQCNMRRSQTEQYQIGTARNPHAKNHQDSRSASE